MSCVWRTLHSTGIGTIGGWIGYGGLHLLLEGFCNFDVVRLENIAFFHFPHEHELLEGSRTLLLYKPFLAYFVQYIIPGLYSCR